MTDEFAEVGEFKICKEILELDVSVGAAGLVVKPSPKSSSQQELVQQLRTIPAFGARLSKVMPVLLELEIGVLEGNQLLVDANNVYQLYATEFGIADFLPPYAPLKLVVTSTGALGRANFGFKTEWRVGQLQAYPSVRGPFAKRGSAVMLLGKEIVGALAQIQNFNDASANYKEDLPWALKQLSGIKSYQSESVLFDEYILGQKVIEVTRMNIGIADVGNSRFTLYPYFENVGHDAMKQNHLRLLKPQGVYEIVDESGSKLRVVPSPDVLNAIGLLSETYRTSKEKVEGFAEAALRKLSEIDALDAVNLSTLKTLIKREDTSANSEPAAKLEPIDVLANSPDSDGHISDAQIRDRNLRSPDIDGSEAKGTAIGGASPEPEILEINDESERDQSITAKNFEMSFKPSGGARVLNLTDVLKNDGQSVTPTHTDDFEIKEQLAGTWKSTSEGLIYEVPASLVKSLDGKPFALKHYQKQGIAWLQFCLKKYLEDIDVPDRRLGALLADDMGLGKTLQVLVFLAWCIESALPDSLGKSVNSFEPIFIVAPLILLPVWEKELQRFFNASGSVFRPLLILHGESLTKMKAEDGANKKALDVTAIRTNRLVITNYDTLKNYYASLSEVPWSVVIADEAQEIKESGTTISECMRGLKRRFSLAITGTPIENKLLDLWSLIEFVQPKLLGGFSEFKNRFEQSPSQVKESIKALKTTLQYATPNTYVLRRTKILSLEGLPEKKNIVRITPLTAVQKAVHSEIMSEVSSQSGATGQFASLQRLLKVYQHIALDGGNYLDKSPHELIADSYKLRDCVDLLRDIKRRAEKVLLFTRSVDMQIVLKQVIDGAFGVDTAIINGSTSTGPSSNKKRQEIINRFENSDGFGALILSPEVAGVGLTITAANNVIHYGRWWNPAKEAQATDRVYRLGQTRKVNVYYLLSSAEQYSTFDEKLHMMLASKMSLARDFLTTSDDWNVRESDLLRELARNFSPSEKSEQARRGLDLSALSNKEFEAFVACYWRRHGYSVMLLPGDCSEIARLIAYGTDNVLVIKFGFDENQPVHVQVGDISEAVLLFQKRFARGKAAKLQWTGVLCSRVRFSKDQAKKMDSSIMVHDINDFQKFLKLQSTTMTDIFREECNRIRNMQEVPNLFR